MDASPKFLKRFTKNKYSIVFLNEFVNIIVTDIFSYYLTVFQKLAAFL
jgi:hypothetical protein